ncbi:linear amide C-N hydrolase [bacterium]|nr:linear amide C-N hydrolase [bacterium]MBT5015483.1 linear amide C-N hydrolase [bacterium]
MKKFLLGVLLVFSGTLIPCSNIMIIGNGFAATARTMDFPVNTGGVLGIGLAGDKNETDLNLAGGQFQTFGVRWKNKYNFIGQTWCGGNIVLDGLNTKGLYAAYLYLPDFTDYPALGHVGTKRMLGITNIINYILGMASSVNEALKLLATVELVPNAIHTNTPSDPGLYVEMPIHLVIRDKSGSSAVIEWIKGKTKVHKGAGPVLTNAPPYGWQLKNAAKYDYVKPGNTDVKVDGAFMEGSGFHGIPGDWTPPSRFARATQLVRNMPLPTSNNGALRNALTVIESVQAPLGANPSPSMWKSLSDMKNSIYYFYPMYTVSPFYATLGKDKNATLSSVNPVDACQRYEVAKIAKSRRLPKGMVRVKLRQTPQKNIKRIENSTHTLTPGPEKS